MALSAFGYINWDTGTGNMVAGQKWQAGCTIADGGQGAVLGFTWQTSGCSITVTEQWVSGNTTNGNGSTFAFTVDSVDDGPDAIVYFCGTYVGRQEPPTHSVYANTVNATA